MYLGVGSFSHHHCRTHTTTQKTRTPKASVFTEVCMTEVGQIFGRKCEQAAGRQLLLEQLINMHEKNTARY